MTNYIAPKGLVPASEMTGTDEAKMLLTALVIVVGININIFSTYGWAFIGFGAAFGLLQLLPVFKSKNGEKLEQASKELQVHLKDEYNLELSLEDCSSLLLGRNVHLPAPTNATTTLTLDIEASAFNVETVSKDNVTLGSHQGISGHPAPKEPTKVLPSRLFTSSFGRKQPHSTRPPLSDSDKEAIEFMLAQPVKRT